MENISKNANKLHEEFKAQDTEHHTMEQSLSGLKDFCDDKINAVPSTAFDDFAKTV